MTYSYYNVVTLQLLQLDTLDIFIKNSGQADDLWYFNCLDYSHASLQTAILYTIYLLYVTMGTCMYRIAGNFRGAKYLWFSWLEV